MPGSSSAAVYACSVVTDTADDGCIPQQLPLSSGVNGFLPAPGHHVPVVKRASPRKRAPAPSTARAPQAVPVAEARPPIALVLIDDNRLLREGMAAMIHTQPGFKVLAASADVDEALKKVREAKPDVVLLDFGLEDHDSLSLTATVHAEVPAARVIVMGLLPLQEDVADYVRAGASGFIMKDASFEDFFATIRAVAAGAEVLPQALTDSLFTQIALNALGGDQGQGAGVGAPDRPGAGGHRPPRRGAEQQGDRHAAPHRGAHRQEPRAQRPREAGAAQPPRGGRLLPLSETPLAVSRLPSPYIHRAIPPGPVCRVLFGVVKKKESSSPALGAALGGSVR